MGLCKCPKRRATNLFCFEHRVNVCEYCLVDVHESVSEVVAEQVAVRRANVLVLADRQRLRLQVPAMLRDFVQQGDNPSEVFS